MLGKSSRYFILKFTGFARLGVFWAWVGRSAVFSGIFEVFWGVFEVFDGFGGCFGFLPFQPDLFIHRDMRFEI